MNSLRRLRANKTLDAYTFDYSRHEIARERKALFAPLSRVERWLVNFFTYAKAEEPDEQEEAPGYIPPFFHEW